MVIAAVYLLPYSCIAELVFFVMESLETHNRSKVINRTRLLAFGWLFGAPVFIFFTAIYWVSAMRLITDLLSDGGVSMKNLFIIPLILVSLMSLPSWGPIWQLCIFSRWIQCLMWRQIWQLYTQQMDPMSHMDRVTD